MLSSVRDCIPRTKVCSRDPFPEQRHLGFVLYTDSEAIEPTPPVPDTFSVESVCVQPRLATRRMQGLGDLLFLTNPSSLAAT